MGYEARCPIDGYQNTSLLESHSIFTLQPPLEEVENAHVVFLLFLIWENGKLDHRFSIATSHDDAVHGVEVRGPRFGSSCNPTAMELTARCKQHTLRHRTKISRRQF